jgi:hypothetical protein
MKFLRKEDLHDSFYDILFRPNLLANGDYKSWSKGISFPTVLAGKENADSWQINGGSVGASVKYNDSFEVTFGDTTTNVSQIIKDRKLNGVFTLSASIKAPLNSTFSITLFRNGVTIGEVQCTGTGDYKTYKTTATISADSVNDLYVCPIFNCSIGTYNIKWAKLELGEYPTPISPLTLYEEQVKSGLAITKTSGDITYYVSPTGSDTTGDGTSAKPFATISKCINILPQVINHVITIQLAIGSYTDTIRTAGFLGSGYIIIKGDNTSLTTASNYIINGRISLIKNTCEIQFIGISSKSTISYNCPLVSYHCNFIYFDKCVFDGTPLMSSNENNGIYFYNTRAVAVGCSFNNFKTSLNSGRCIYADYTSNVFFWNTSGTNNDTGYASYSGSKIAVYGSTLVANVLRYRESGGEITGGTEMNTISFSAGTYYSSGNLIKCKVNGNHVHFCYLVSSNSTQTNSETAYEMLKIGNYKPSSEAPEYGICIVYQSGVGIVKTTGAYINPDGSIFVEGAISTGFMYRFIFDYIVD